MIRVHRRVDSETLHLPELKPLLGRSVEIIIRAEDEPQVTPGTGDWTAAEQAVERLRQAGYDFDAWREQRQYDVKHSLDHLRDPCGHVRCH